MNKPLKLFRDHSGNIKPLFSQVEGVSYQESPFDFYIRLARYKFAARFIKSTDIVLDIGCGPGIGTIFLSQFAKNVIGVDVDYDLIKENSQNYKKIKNVAFSYIDIVSKVMKKRAYDIVVSMDVIEHFTKEQVETVALNYAR
jgi:2-polyprenyl-3-methyl-5-hydroxy-6-metoxy-1,4-benzoquinol methylase